ncbi:MAG: hypothetical protein KDC84_01625 [Crocinitomicaceae bacterium]|nr:hypothetical protein [Crocinitomicaceae bacterium]
MRFTGLLSILNITFCFLFVSSTQAQIGRTENKKGTIYNYYSGSDNLHSSGKQDDKGKQGRWSFYTDAPKESATEYQYFTYRNDTLNGPFLKLGDGNRISGLYVNGHYQGMIVIEDVIITGTDTAFLLVEEGSYENGMKSSFFKEYKKGVLESEGGFDEDKKNGSWKFYDISGDSPVLMRKTYFKRDVKDGKEITYFEYDENGQKIEKRSEYFYKEDVKNGPFEIKLNGQTIEKGNYADGKLSGDHQIFIKEMDLNRFANFYEGKMTGPVSFKDMNDVVRISGSYDNGKKSATWTYKDKNGKIEKEESYQNDEPIDNWKYYTDGKLNKLVKYEKGNATEVIEYEAGTDKVLAEFYLKDVTGTFQEVEALIYYKDSSKTINVLMAVSLLEDPSNILEMYKKNHSNKEMIKRNGLYEFSLKGIRVLEGYYENDKKAGKWNFFYHPDVIWEKSFTAGELTGERFVDKGVKSPWKGSYEVNWENGNPRFKFKIKDGLRNGKQEYFKENGEEEKVDKFKEGVKE